MLGFFQLHGKRILVTGASSGIGRATAIECAKAGGNIIASGRDVKRLSEVFNQVAEISSASHAQVVIDINDQSAVDNMVLTLPELDGVVHCAGIDGVAPMHLVRKDHLQSVVNTNFIAPAMLTRQLLIKKKINKAGSIIFISSIAASTGTHGIGPYSASKAALIGVMRPLALELSKHKIRVNSISPGLVETPLLNSKPESFDSMTKNYPLGGGHPEDIALACVFFLADASKKITGTVFSIDGGVPFT